MHDMYDACIYGMYTYGIRLNVTQELTHINRNVCGRNKFGVIVVFSYWSNIYMYICYVRIVSSFALTFPSFDANKLQMLS